MVYLNPEFAAPSQGSLQPKEKLMFFGKEKLKCGCEWRYMVSAKNREEDCELYNQ